MESVGSDSTTEGMTEGKTKGGPGKKTYALLRQCRALDVLDGAELSCEPLTRLGGHRSLLLPRELVEHGGVVAQVDLSSDDEARNARAVVVHLGEPLFLDVLERGGRGDAEADEEDVGLRVRERTQPVVVLLSGRIEQAEGVRVVADHDRHRLCSVTTSATVFCVPDEGLAVTTVREGRTTTYVIVKDGGNIFARELVGGVRNQETCLCRRWGRVSGWERMSDLRQIGHARTHLSDRTVTDDLQINNANQYQGYPRRRDCTRASVQEDAGWGDMPTEGEEGGSQ